jgi:uncharacterized protein YndB with AHSA1/START domain
MNKQLAAKAEIRIKATPPQVWEALTKPEMVKEYLFGTEMSTDWQVGSQITYKGVWEGKEYEDKGKVIEVVPEQLIVTTYFSPLSGQPDVPENYKTVRYELTSDGDTTTLAIEQDNNATEEERQQSEKNWKMVLEGLKNLLEK